MISAIGQIWHSKGGKCQVWEYGRFYIKEDGPSSPYGESENSMKDLKSLAHVLCHRIVKTLCNVHIS